MQNEKGKNLLIVALAVIVIMLIVILALVINKNNKIDNNDAEKDTTIVDNANEDKDKVNDSAKYTYQGIEGLYGVSIPKEDYEDDYQIYLYENGSFSYVISGVASPSIYVGNYILEDNKINLNYMMHFAAQLDDHNSMKETGVITINDDNTLSISEQPGDVSDKDLTLTKITGQEEQNLIASKVFDIPYLFDNLLDNINGN